MKAVGEGRVDEAIRRFNAALSIHPKYLRALNDLGVLYLKLNRLDEAAATLERALKVNKGFHYVRVNLGVVLTRQGKYKEAVEILKPLTREQPPIEGVTLAYAEALIGLGNLAEAQVALKAAIIEAGADKARELEARFKLGLVLSRSERYAEAVSEFEKVIALDPNAANAHLLLGAALLQLKKLDAAERQLLKAYELGGAQTGNACPVLVPLGKALLPLRRVRCRQGVDRLALRGSFRLGPWSEIGGREVGKRQQQIREIALRIDRQYRDAIDGRFLDERDPEAGLPAAGHADAHGVRQQILGVVEERFRRSGARCEVVLLSEVEETELLVGRHGDIILPLPWDVRVSSGFCAA